MCARAQLEGEGRMSSKKRQSYTIEEKQALCLLAQQHPQMECAHCKFVVQQLDEQL